MNRGRREVERGPSEEGAVQLTKDKSWRTESRGRDEEGHRRGAQRSGMVRLQEGALSIHSSEVLWEPRKLLRKERRVMVIS